MRLGRSRLSGGLGSQARWAWVLSMHRVGCAVVLAIQWAHSDNNGPAVLLDMHNSDHTNCLQRLQFSPQLCVDL